MNVIACHGIHMLQLPNFSFFLDASHFGDSKLNGTLPTELLGDLSNLKMVGPPEVCGLEFKTFAADCARGIQLHCACCTSCLLGHATWNSTNWDESSTANRDGQQGRPMLTNACGRNLGFCYESPPSGKRRGGRQCLAGFMLHHVQLCLGHVKNLRPFVSLGVIV
jgi:hypothetical protein